MLKINDSLTLAPLEKGKKDLENDVTLQYRSNHRRCFIKKVFFQIRRS